MLYWYTWFLIVFLSSASIFASLILFRSSSPPSSASSSEVLRRPNTRRIHGFHKLTIPPPDIQRPPRTDRLLPSPPPPPRLTEVVRPTKPVGATLITPTSKGRTTRPDHGSGLKVSTLPIRLEAQQEHVQSRPKTETGIVPTATITPGKIPSTRNRKVAVLIQGNSRSASLNHTITRILDVYLEALSSDWPIRVYVVPSLVDLVHWIQLHSILFVTNRFDARTRVSFYELPYELDNHIHNQLLRSRWFWRDLKARHVLLFQTDAVICRNTSFPIESFLKYDYVGAPWTVLWAPVARLDGLWVNGFNVLKGGNGGLSLRNAYAMLRCLRQVPPYPRYMHYPEDVYFVICLSRLGRSVNSRQVGLRFSSETSVRVDSLGYHKTFIGDPVMTHRILERCPAFQYVPRMHFNQPLHLLIAKQPWRPFIHTRNAAEVIWKMIYDEETRILNETGRLVPGVDPFQLLIDDANGTVYHAQPILG